MGDRDVSGDRLRDARLSMDPLDGGMKTRTVMSQGALASLIDVDGNTVRNWERKGIPNAAVLRRLAEVTGWSLDELLGG